VTVSKANVVKTGLGAPRKKQNRSSSPKPATNGVLNESDIDNDLSDTNSYTPDINPTNPNRPRLSVQTPNTKVLVPSAKNVLRVQLCTQNPFPDRTQLVSMIASSFKIACAETNMPEKWARFQKNWEYCKAVEQMVSHFINVI